MNMHRDNFIQRNKFVPNALKLTFYENLLCISETRKMLTQYLTTVNESNLIKMSTWQLTNDENSQKKAFTLSLKKKYTFNELVPERRPVVIRLGIQVRQWEAKVVNVCCEDKRVLSRFKVDSMIQSDLSRFKMRKYHQSFVLGGDWHSE